MSENALEKKQRKYPLIADVSENPADYKFKTTLRVRFNETDAQGIVNNAVYFTYFEIARVEYLRHAFGDDFFEQREFSATVGEAGCRFLSSAVFGQTINVHVRVPEIYRVSYVYEYLMRDAHTNANMATGYTTIVILSPQTLRPVPVPESFVKGLLEFEKDSVRIVG